MSTWVGGAQGKAVEVNTSSYIHARACVMSHDVV